MEYFDKLVSLITKYPKTAAIVLLAGGAVLGVYVLAGLVR